MVEQVYESPDIYRIKVTLPDSPLRVLNSYVVRHEDEVLIIDTGFNQEPCYESFMEGIRELDIDPKKASFFITHLHSDHTGLVCKVTDEQTKIYMSELDYAYFSGDTVQVYWGKMEDIFRKEGLSESLIEQQRTVNPARSFAPSGIFKAICLKDGDEISVGPHKLRMILTPGHTPGNTCLYMEKEQILFSGDHILFDITPNITMWLGPKDSLGDYLESLDKVRALPIKLTLPGHRENHMDVYERIDQIKIHHEKRLNQVVEILRENLEEANGSDGRIKPGLNACDISAKMSWKMRGRTWEDFPIQQKWFALGETIAHLDYLLVRGIVERHESEDAIYYTLMS